MQIERIYQYPLDLLGNLKTNLISGEVYDINATKSPIVIINEGVYYTDTLKLLNGSTGVALRLNIDYKCVCYDIDASAAAGGRSCHAAFMILKPESAPAKILAEYRLIGGEYVNRVGPIISAAINIRSDKRQTDWDNITNKPTEYPPMGHTHYLSEITDWGALIQAIRDCSDVLIKLVPGMESRLSKMIHNLDVDNTSEHHEMLSLLEYLNSNYNNIKNNINSIKQIVDHPVESFDMFALKATKINGHNLAKDIILTAPEVDAVSASKGGTFKSGFVDAKTNIGKISNCQRHIITNKGQIDDLVAGTMISVYKNNAKDIMLPMDPGLGQLVKLVTDNDNFRIGYMVLLYGSNGIIYHGFANSATNITWTKFVTGNTKEEIIPGMLIPYTGLIPPEKYFVPMGQKYSIKDNPGLAKIYPSGILPDIRAAFLRMFDNGRGIDPDRAILTFQDHAMEKWIAKVQSIDRNWPIELGEQCSTIIDRWNTQIKAGSRDLWGTVVAIDPTLTGVKMAHETRPYNYSVNLIIKGG